MNVWTKKLSLNCGMGGGNFGVYVSVTECYRLGKSGSNQIDRADKKGAEFWILVLTKTTTEFVKTTGSESTEDNMNSLLVEIRWWRPDRDGAVVAGGVIQIYLFS